MSRITRLLAQYETSSLASSSWSHRTAKSLRCSIHGHLPRSKCYNLNTTSCPRCLGSGRPSSLHLPLVQRTTFAVPESVGQLYSLRTLEVDENRLSATIAGGTHASSASPCAATRSLRFQSCRRAARRRCAPANLPRSNALKCIGWRPPQACRVCPCRSRGNRIPKLPGEVGDLNRLQTLDISNNDISALPHELGFMKSSGASAWMEIASVHFPRGSPGGVEGLKKYLRSRAPEGYGHASSCSADDDAVAPGPGQRRDSAGNSCRSGIRPPGRQLDLKAIPAMAMDASVPSVDISVPSFPNSPRTWATRRGGHSACCASAATLCSCQWSLRRSFTSCTSRECAQRRWIRRVG